MSNYTSKTTIDEYIDKSELNSRIYQTLLYLQDSTANVRHKLKRQPLEIFNQAYAICDELQQEKHPEEKVVQIWDKPRPPFLSYETSEIFSRAYIYYIFHGKEKSKYEIFPELYPAKD
jgi:fumarate hydratase class II